jgi:transcriptional regulator of arginine metabolism
VKRFTVARRLTLSSTARRALIIDLIQKGEIYSQSDLQRLLNEEGVAVTQATISRDLLEVGAVRGRGIDGVVRYSLPSDIDAASELSRKVSTVSDELITDINVSENLVVVKTAPGGANLMASALDRASKNGELSNIIGTIAGDDTVLVIARTTSAGKVLAEELRDYIGHSLSKRPSVKRKKKKGIRS